VSIRASQLDGQQDKNKTNDAVMTTVGVVIFWPSLLFLKGDGPTAAELGRMRGEAEALQRVSIEKKCDIQFNGAPTPEKS
jgi:hypothetical protein